MLLQLPLLDVECMFVYGNRALELSAYSFPYQQLAVAIMPRSGYRASQSPSLYLSLIFYIHDHQKKNQQTPPLPCVVDDGTGYA